MFNPKEETQGLNAPLLESDVDLEGGEEKKDVRSLTAKDLVYTNETKMTEDYYDGLKYHQKIDKTKFVFMTNPNYVPADLDSDDEDP